MALFHRHFDILRIKIAAVDDDQILQAAGNIQFAIFEKSQIPSAQKRPLTGILQVCPAGALCFFGRFQYPRVMLGPDAQISPTSSGAQVVIDSGWAMTTLVSSMARPLPTSVRTFRSWAEASTTRFCSSAAPDRANDFIPQRAAGHQQGRFGQAVTGMEGAGRKPQGAKVAANRFIVSARIGSAPL